MATATAVQQPNTVLHVRGTWSARDDRTCSAVVLGLMWIGMIAGFAVDFPRYLSEKPAPPTVVHVHAVVFTVWMLIVTAQILLVLGDRISWHRKFGWFLAGWACLMAILGPWAAMAAQAIDLHTALSDPQFLSVNIVDLGGFLVFLACGIALRKNPAVHKRMMMLSLIALADPGFARFTGHFWPEPASVLPWFIYMFYGNVLLIVVMAAWDWRRRRLMRPSVFGATALIVAQFLASVVYFWEPWKALTLGWVQAWARLSM